MLSYHFPSLSLHVFRCTPGSEDVDFCFSVPRVSMHPSIILDWFFKPCWLEFLLPSLLESHVSHIISCLVFFLHFLQNFFHHSPSQFKLSLCTPPQVNLSDSGISCLRSSSSGLHALRLCISHRWWLSIHLPSSSLRVPLQRSIDLSCSHRAKSHMTPIQVSLCKHALASCGSWELNLLFLSAGFSEKKASKKQKQKQTDGASHQHAKLDKWISKAVL